MDLLAKLETLLSAELTANGFTLVDISYRPSEPLSEGLYQAVVRMPNADTVYVCACVMDVEENNLHALVDNAIMQLKASK